MITTAVVHRGHGSIVCFPPLEACMVPSGTMKASSQKRLFSSNSGTSGACFCSGWCFHSQGPTFHLWEATKNYSINRLHDLESLG